MKTRPSTIILIIIILAISAIIVTGCGSGDNCIINEASMGNCSNRMPAYGETGTNTTPPIIVYKLENNKWIKTSNKWSGNKIALMVHGIAGRKEDMLALAVYLSKKKVYDKIYAVQYKLGYKIESQGKKLANIIRSKQPAGSTFHIIAHSMGGLIARSAVENHGIDKSTKKLVMMGTPQTGVFGVFMLSLLSKGCIPKVVPEFDDLSPGSDFLTELNNKKPVKVRYYAAVGTNGENLKEYFTFKYFGESVIKALSGSSVVDGLVPANSAGYDLGKECSKWEKKEFPVSHAYIRGGNYGSGTYEDVMEQVSKWVEAKD